MKKIHNELLRALARYEEADPPTGELKEKFQAVKADLKRKAARHIQKLADSQPENSISNL